MHSGIRKLDRDLSWQLSSRCCHTEKQGVENENKWSRIKGVEKKQDRCSGGKHHPDLIFFAACGRLIYACLSFLRSDML